MKVLFINSFRYMRLEMFPMVTSKYFRAPQSYIFGVWKSTLIQTLVSELVSELSSLLFVIEYIGKGRSKAF